MFHETCARAEEILSLNVPDLDMEFRRALVTEKGGDRAYVHWETPTARLLAGRRSSPIGVLRQLGAVRRRWATSVRRPAGAGCPIRVPSTCSSRLPGSTIRTAPGTRSTSCATPG
ncbi:hypothetical protein GA0070216_102509 [Micromonospora matsumotoense]|uniref:Uncharacterized protein n=1 Tax=Micromonospora matsumotoense TaxID=121616 RepID=A0A1C4VPB4_9ACTN|nr:hypothetical protein [Micromonospora matsumotoense]SCE85780.1 hypothetical protein GA0070216_102509 [Micromonospora matsumotoense]